MSKLDILSPKIGVIASILVCLCVVFSSCNKDVFSDNPDVVFSSSQDTIRFDTVFTQVGSTTKFFKLYNEESEDVIIDKVEIKNQNSFFRINVDGINAQEVEGTRVAAGDSVYVFVEVTIDPDNPVSISPFIIEDQVSININGGQDQIIYLEAWGQNANYIPSRFSQSEINYYSCDMGQWIWDDPKPYVIYGSVVIDSCELVWPPGTEVYVHGGVAINDFGVFTDGLVLFLANGKLTSNGTIDEPVLVKSDRLEPDFDQTPGMWSGILLTPESTGNSLRYTNISNSIVGVQIDSLASASLVGCCFSYTSGTGIQAIHSNVYAENCLLHDNGISGVSLTFGGNYEFNYCTIVNEGNQDPALQMTNYRCYDSFCGIVKDNPLKATFRNSIITGNERDEIILDDLTPDTDDDFTYLLDHCFVKVDELLDSDAWPDFFEFCLDCDNIGQEDLLFLNPDSMDYSLDTMSLAIDRAKKLIFVPQDKIGTTRGEMPDIGCFEFF